MVCGYTARSSKGNQHSTLEISGASIPIEDLPMVTRSWMKPFRVLGSVKHQHHSVGLPSLPSL